MSAEGRGEVAHLGGSVDDGLVNHDLDLATSVILVGESEQEHPPVRSLTVADAGKFAPSEPASREKYSELRPKDSANVQLGADSRFSTYWTRRENPVLELRRVVVDDADSRAIGAGAVERDRVG